MLEPVAADAVSLQFSEEETRALIAAANSLVLLLHRALSADGRLHVRSAAVRKPAVSVDETVRRDYIVCLEDGAHVKSLKTYIKRFGMTPQQYRDRWGLPPSYPMVAVALSEQRAKIARRVRPHLSRKRLAGAGPPS